MTRQGLAVQRGRYGPERNILREFSFRKGDDRGGLGLTS